MPTTSTHVLSTSRKHMIGFFVESFGKRCASTVLTATCYWPSSHCILAQKFVSMSGVYKNWIWSSLLWGEGLQGPGPLTGGEVGIPAWPAKDCKGNPGSFRFSVFRGGMFLPQTGNWSSVKSHWNDFLSDVFGISKIALDVKIKSSIQLISKADTLPAQFIRFYVWKICLSVKISIFTAGNVCILHYVFFLKNFVDCCWASGIRTNVWFIQVVRSRWIE